MSCLGSGSGSGSGGSGSGECILDGSTNGSGSGSGGVASKSMASGLEPEQGVELNYTVVVTTDGGQTSVLVPQLAPYTWYQCFVTANTSIGEGERSSTDVNITDEAGDFPDHSCNDYVTQ